jgi:hypothetical protein
MLQFMFDHESALLGHKIQRPLWYDDFWTNDADDGWANGPRKQNPLSIDDRRTPGTSPPRQRPRRDQVRSQRDSRDRKPTDGECTIEPRERP